jgi:hypothetical protein
MESGFDRAGAGAVRSRIRRLSDAEKIVFADAVLRWIELGGTIKVGALGFPPILTEDDLEVYKALVLAFIFPDGERSIWVESDD